MRKLTLATALLLVVSLNAQAFWFGYDNFDECEKGKHLEYIDDGRENAWSDAWLYCNLKFPTLDKPKWVKITNGFKGTWNTYSYGENQYTLTLDEKAYKDITFYVSFENGKTQYFKDKELEYGYKLTFQASGKVINVMIDSATKNINYGKRKGD